MDAKTQIIVLLFSYFYGLIFYFLSKLNNYIIKSKKRLFRSIITILFTYNIVLIYLIILYKLNNGAFHIYFLLMGILGYLTSSKYLNKMLKNVKFPLSLAKFKKK